MSVYLAYNNYIDNLNSVDASSEQALYPETNLYNDRRIKVWRSNGYYNVTSSNNEIVFNEGGGDVTATISVAEYNSGTTFLAAVEAALEAVSPGSANYTVSYDATTGKIKIATTAGTLNIKWGSSSAADLLGFDATDDTGATSYIADVLRLHTSEWVTFDLGVASIPYGFIALNQRNEAIPLSPTATIKIQGNPTNNFTTSVFDQTISYSERALQYFNTDGFTTVGYRYWRFYIEDQQNGDGYVEISKIFLGDMFRPVRGAVQFGARFSPIDTSVTTYTLGGQSYSEERSKSEVFDLQYFGLTNAEKEELETVFSLKGVHQPFLLAVCPSGNAMVTESEYYTRWVKFQAPPSFTIISPGNWGADVSLREQL